MLIFRTLLISSFSPAPRVLLPASSSPLPASAAARFELRLPLAPAALPAALLLGSAALAAEALAEAEVGRVDLSSSTIVSDSCSR